MEALINSFLLVFAGEMGDKTQLLSLILATKYPHRPWVILFGILIATVFNHALAAMGGAWLSSLVNPTTLSYILAATFFIFAIWILIPDKAEDLTTTSHFGVLATTIITFFMAEMGDKTQLATMALGARYTDTVAVTLGSTLGMLASNAIAIFLGYKLLRRISMSWVRRITSFLFLLFAIAILISTY